MAEAGISTTFASPAVGRKDGEGFASAATRRLRQLMKAAAAAMVELARDPRYVGGTVGMLAVLHTWTQQLLFRPHVHCLITGGGISDDGDHWYPSRNAFLVPEKALAKLFRGKLRAAFEKCRPDA